MALDRLPPLRFEPIFKPAIWGGQRLYRYFPPSLNNSQTPQEGNREEQGKGLNSHAGLSGELLESEPIGEAWVLSDQGNQSSRIPSWHDSRVPGGIIQAYKDLQGMSLRHIMQQHSQQILGQAAQKFKRYPLLFKIIDARLPLSIQVHPDDHKARQINQRKGVLTDDLGKTEAWVVLDCEEESLIYAGLQPNVAPNHFRTASNDLEIDNAIFSFHPQIGDCVFLRAGTVHAIGAGLFIFEVQQTSDITYRLHDWNRVDAKTGKPRELHIAESLECIDFASGPCRPTVPQIRCTQPYSDEQLIECEYFSMNRITCSNPISFPPSPTGRVLFCSQGAGQIIDDNAIYPMSRGNTYLMPANLPETTFIPLEPTVLLNCQIPEN